VNCGAAWNGQFGSPVSVTVCVSRRLHEPVVTATLTIVAEPVLFVANVIAFVF